MNEQRSVLDKIAANEASKKVYAALLRSLQGMGPFRMEPKATSLHVVNGRAFLGLHYRKDGLLLNVVLDRPLKSARLTKSEQVSRSRYHHEVLIRDPSDLDEQLLGWIGEAHRLTER